MSDPVQDEADVRLLINDVATGDAQVFSDLEIAAFLRLNRDSVKRAAAAALDVIASNEALVAKVITDHQLSTHGDSVAKALRDHATELRAEADAEDSDDDTIFEIIGGC